MNSLPIFRVLRVQKYRTFFLSQGVSIVGQWMQQTALMWLVYRLTHSAFMLGLVGFVSQFPVMIIAPVAGVLAERFDRRKILICTQTVAMIQAAVLAVLALTGVIAVWHIMVVGIMLGCVTALDMTTRHVFVVELIEQKELFGPAIALYSSMFNVARLVGPLCAGLCVGWFGEGMCFLVNSISFFGVLWCLIAMEHTSVHRLHKDAAMQHALKEGIRYVWHCPPIRALLLLIALISMMGISYATLMPVFAKDILHGGPQTLGLLMASAGVGSLIATALLASRRSPIPFGKSIPVAALLCALGMMAFGFSTNLWFSIVMLVVTGFGFMLYMTMSNTMLQTLAHDDKRGRVMSFYTMAFMGMVPFGSLIIGMLAKHTSAHIAVCISSVCCIIGIVIFLARLPHLQAAVEIHETKKQDMETYLQSGLQTTSELSQPPED